MSVRWHTKGSIQSTGVSVQRLFLRIPHAFAPQPRTLTGFIGVLLHRGRPRLMSIWVFVRTIDRQLMTQTERLEVTGMSCGGCTRKVTDALDAVRGVNGVDVSLADHAATVSFDKEFTSVRQLELAVRNAGYGIGASGVTQPAQNKRCCCA